MHTLSRLCLLTVPWAFVASDRLSGARFAHPRTEACQSPGETLRRCVRGSTDALAACPDRPGFAECEYDHALALTRGRDLEVGVAGRWRTGGRPHNGHDLRGSPRVWRAVDLDQRLRLDIYYRLS